jgi:dTDP-3-amino-3,4,6-trideoxy-alpha-D-glucose transaminase
LVTTAKQPLAVPAGALERESAEIGQEVIGALQRVLDRGWYILGPEVKAFEQEFADYLGVRHAVGVASGTDAITLAVAALGIGPGDEVVMPAMTSVATAVGIINAGARPVLADVDSLTLNLDAQGAANVITSSTKAIMAVHLYGRPAPMPALIELARRHGVAVIEDACQAHGAMVGSRKAGSCGVIGCFSFYPSKNLGAYGDGGIAVTDDPEIADRLRLLRQYGWRERDHSDIRGWNSRLDEMQAAILRVKLPHLDGWNARRREIAVRYTDGLTGLTGLELPPADAGHCWHLYPVMNSDRDRLREHLASRGIVASIHYPVPVHLQPGIRDLLRGGQFPVAEAAASRLLSLPIFPQLTDREVNTVVGSVRSFLK